jgi:hypothetical protein
MPGRRVVVDMNVAHAAPVDACPGCGVSLAWVRKEALRLVAFDWRCGPGHHPRTFELRCRDCTRLAIVYETKAGGLAFVGDQDGALRHTRERAHEDAVLLTRSDGRDRDR